MSTAKEKLAHARELYLRGYYTEAIAEIEPLLKQESLEAAFRAECSRLIGHVCVVKGEAKQGQQIVQETIAELHSQLEAPQVVLLQVQLDFIMVVGCGEHASNHKQWQDAYEYVDQCIEREELKRDEAHRIYLTQQMTTRGRDADVKPTIASRLRQVLLAVKDSPADIWTLFSGYQNSEDDEPVLVWLRDFLDNPDLEAVFQGLFGLKLAKILGDRGELTACNQWLIKTEQAFQACQHKYGHIEVARLHIYFGIESTADKIQALLEIAQKYVQMGLPIQFVKAMSCLLSISLNSSNYRAFIELHDMFQSVCMDYSIQLERLILNIQFLGQMAGSSSYAGRTLEIAKSLYTECQASQFWTFAWLAGEAAISCYLGQNSSSNAEALAIELLNMCIRERLQSQSEAEYLVAEIKSRLQPAEPEIMIANCQNIVTELLPTIDTDEANADWTQACKKLRLLVRLQYQVIQQSPDSAEVFTPVAEQMMARLKTASDMLPDDDRIEIQAQTDLDVLTYQMHTIGASSDNSIVLMAAQRHLELSEMYQRQNKMKEAALRLYSCSACYRLMYLKTNFYQGLPYRIEECDVLGSAEQIFATLELTRLLLFTRHAIIRTTFECWIISPTPSNDLVNKLFALEATVDTLRQELSAIGGLEALLAKQQFVQQPQHADIYKWAMVLALRSSEPASMWLWSQKHKAKSLSDMLGLGVLTPASMKLHTNDEEGFSLLQEMDALNKALATASVSEKGRQRLLIADLENKMKMIPSLKSFLVLKNGIVEDISQLSELMAKDKTLKQKRSIVFIDWSESYNTLYLVAINCDTHSSKFFALPHNLGTVESWRRLHFANDEARRRCLSGDTLEEADHPMRELDFLIAPLVDCSDEGDLLVFSTTGCLSTLPLHALKVPGNSNEPIIARNPIVYAQSLPILQLCLSRSLSIDPNSCETRFLSVYDVDTIAQQAHRELSKIAPLLRGQSFTGRQITKSTFGNIVANSRIVHFYGHCWTDTENILRQAIVLGEDLPDESIKETAISGRQDPMLVKNVVDASNESSSCLPDQTCSNDLIAQQTRKITEVAERIKQVDIENENELTLPLLKDNDTTASTHLTVEEIFKLRLSSPLVTLVACGSSMQTIATGDEPLGLTAGLLCAGAASVIGALWNVKTGTGIEFSKIFYEELLNCPVVGHDPKAESGAGQLGFRDLAVALQQAVLKMRNEFQYMQTYNWGAFCLHGSWLLAL